MEPIDRVFIMKALTSSEGQAAIKAMTGPDAYAYFLALVCSAPTIDPIRAAGWCYCGECRFEEDCEKQVTIVRRDYVLEQNVYDHRRIEWCGVGEPREAQDNG